MSHLSNGTYGCKKNYKCLDFFLLSSSASHSPRDIKRHGGRDRLFFLFFQDTRVKSISKGHFPSCIVYDGLVMWWREIDGRALSSGHAVGLGVALR